MNETNSPLMTEAVNQAVKDKPGISNNLEALILEAHKRFIDLKVNDFPRICEIARVQNKIKIDELKEVGYKGKYTDSYGWSKDGSFKFEFDIPNELYLFMTNLVYKNFWSNENKRIHKAFMNAICRGDDPIQTLMKVKSYYGSNKDISLIT